MIIIGEKINGSIPSMAKAIANRDAEWVKDIALKQANAGADFIDVCASLNEGELDAMKWLIDCVQEVTDVPIAVDSPSVDSCVAAMQFCNKPGLFNSVSGEGNKLDVGFAAISGTKWQVVALLCDDTGIPKSAADRLKVFDKVMAKAKEYNIAPNRIHIDPLIEMLCTADDGEGISMVIEVMTKIKEQYPTIHITGAVSNISFNLPKRKLVNQAFTVLAMNAGLDSAVFDPLNTDLQGMIFATEAMLGEDDLCCEYMSAYREGRFGPVK